MNSFIFLLSLLPFIKMEIVSFNIALTSLMMSVLTDEHQK